MVLKGGGGEQKRCLEGVCVCVGGVYSYQGFHCAVII